MVPEAAQELLVEVYRLVRKVVEDPALARRSFAHRPVPGLTTRAERECLLALFVLGPSVVTDVAAVVGRSDNTVRNAIRRLREHRHHYAVERELDNGDTRYEVSGKGSEAVRSAWKDDYRARLLATAFTRRVSGSAGTDSALGFDDRYAAPILLAVTFRYARTVHSLAMELSLNAASVSQGAECLQRLGLIHMFGDPDDRRHHVISPSHEGHELVFRLVVAAAELVPKRSLQEPEDDAGRWNYRRHR
jgi:hypothetical protein